MHSLEKEKILASIGSSLRMARLQSNKSTKEMAAHLAITTQAYGKMERGRCDICITRLIELAKFHKTSVNAFIPEEYSDIVLSAN